MISSAAFALTAAKRAPGRHPEGTRPVGAGRGKPQQRGENRSGVHPDSVSGPASTWQSRVVWAARLTSEHERGADGLTVSPSCKENVVASREDQISSGTASHVQLPLFEWKTQAKPTQQNGAVSSPSSFWAPQPAPCAPQHVRSLLLALTATSQI